MIRHRGYAADEDQRQQDVFGQASVWSGAEKLGTTNTVSSTSRTSIPLSRNLDIGLKAMGVMA